MLPLTRRRAIIVSVSALLSPSVAHARGDGSAGAPDTDTLAAFLDVLLPRDAFSPSASQLDVHADLLDIAQEVELYPKLIALGTRWLNDTGRGPFHDLPPGDRIKVVAWMSTSDFNRIPGRFYSVVRFSAIEIYYSHPEAIAGFNLNPAPQPVGYPPPWD